MMTINVLVWWAGLCSLAGLNVLAWVASAAALRRRGAHLPEPERSWRRLQLLLCAGYVAGCAFRSVLPVYDVPRLGLVDSALSTVLVGRSVATLAELCFAAQWAMLLRAASQGDGGAFGRVVAAALVPLIVVAETFSWYSVLTTSNLGHVVEESIWALSAALLIAGLAARWPKLAAPLRPLYAAVGAAGAVYVAFMVLIDVPMYASRWLADEAAGRAYLSIAQGLLDVAHRTTVSLRWQDWHTEVPWMSLYFSVGVWISLALVHAPAFERRVHLGPHKETGRRTGTFQTS
jgi:hypothetical protein